MWHAHTLTQMHIIHTTTHTHIHKLKVGQYSVTIKLELKTLHSILSLPLQGRPPSAQWQQLYPLDPGPGKWIAPASALTGREEWADDERQNGRTTEIQVQVNSRIHLCRDYCGDLCHFCVFSSRSSEISIPCAWNWISLTPNRHLI